MPVAVIDAVFMAQLGDLTGFSLAAAGAVVTGAGRTWTSLSDRTGVVDPFDIPRIADDYERISINEQYVDALNSGAGSAGDVVSLHLQGDYLSAMERAYRLRSASRIRRATWRAARHLGHADTGQGVFARVAGYAQDMITAGTVGFVPIAPSNPDALEAEAITQNQVRRDALALPADFTEGF